MTRINLQATIEQVNFPDPVWQWLDLYGDMLVATQEEGLAHETFVADNPFKRLMVDGTNRMIGSLTSIYMLLRCEYIDLAAAQVRVLCEALITLCFVARDPAVRSAAFWDYYTIEACETASAMIALERGRAKPEHLAGMERWLRERQPEHDRLKPKYTYVVPRGKDKGKQRPFRNWCNVTVAKQAEECGADLDRLYRLVYKQMSSYVHCTAFSLRRQTAYSRAHYDAGVVHRDMATLVRITAIVWIEMSKFLSRELGWDLMPRAATVAEGIERLAEQHFGGHPTA